MKTNMINSGIGEILGAKGLDRDNAALRERINSVTKEEVERALETRAGIYSFEKLMALISPAGEDYIEQMAQMARQLTLQRFGRTVKLYAPLYVSNYCVNKCRYCGFNHGHHFERKRLGIEHALSEADIIAQEGFRDILLVSGEDRSFVTIDYLCELARRLREKFSYVSLEIHQLERDEYAKLFEAGIEGVTIYQETYDRERYGYFHPSGPKADYERRLRGPEDICGAGMREVGLGFLMGLKDFRVETLAMAEHASYLMKKYWQSHVSFSFPRIRPATEVERGEFEHLVSDKQLVQMIVALRLCFADAGCVLSTRESAKLRDNLIKIGITRTSAGSKTNVGGYGEGNNDGGQFEVNDGRSVGEVVEVIRKEGFEAVWKDWDRGFLEVD